MIINTDEWLTASEAEKQYKLFSGCVRQNIHRGKFNKDEYTKLGHTWLIKISALKKYEGK